MARHQFPAVDLSSGDADPLQAQLSLLEIQLFTAAFDRILIFPQTPTAPSSSGAHSASFSQMDSNSQLAQEDPCSKYKGLFYGPMANVILPEGLAQQLGDFGITYGVGEALDSAVEKMGLDTDDFGKAMAAANVFARISKLIAIYSSLSVTVTVAGDNPVHKPLEGEPVLQVEFDAKVGVSDDDWKDYEQKYGEAGMAADRVARDCLSTLGIPTLANTGDITAAIESFAVEWRIVSGSPEHAHDSDADLQDQNCSYHQVRLRCKLLSYSDHSAVSSYRLDVIESKPPETKELHDNGVLESANVKVCAAVDASEAPSLSTFINGAIPGLGIADSIAELAGGMILKLGKPEGCTKLEVTYHIQRGWKVDGPFGETHIFGEICSLDIPFTLQWDSGVGLAGTITFSPSSENGGTWSLEGAFDPGVTNAGEGSYTIESNPKKAPTAIALEGTASQTTVGYGTITHPFSETIQLYPNECSQP
jgi:hypothetical protein